MELFLSLCLGVGLAACCGFRIFVPLLLTNIATMNHFVEVSKGFEWLGGWTAFVVLATATVVEVIAYYIPWLDNLIDGIAAPAAVAAGTVLGSSFIKIDDPVLQWGLGLMMGGSTAGMVHTGTGLIRLASTKLTGGIANPVFATIENILSVGFSLLSFWLPLVAFVGVILFVIWVIKKLTKPKPTP